MGAIRCNRIFGCFHQRIRIYEQMIANVVNVEHYMEYQLAFMASADTLWIGRNRTEIRHLDFKGQPNDLEN